MTLLEKARAARVLPGRPPFRPASADEIELALAWLLIAVSRVVQAFGLTVLPGPGAPIKAGLK